MARPTLFLLLLSACSGTTIDTTSYDRSCMNDGQCAVVFQGDACAACPCVSSAVSTSAVVQYQKDLATLATRCPVVATPVNCPICPKRVGLCTGGRCSARPE